FTARIYGRFENGELRDELAAKSGLIPHTGFHTINLDVPVKLADKQKFYVSLDVSHGGQAIDRTSVIPVLLRQGKSSATPTVKSKANPGESFYFDGKTWRDLYDFEFSEPSWNRTANFCMKALAVEATPKKQ